jgi:hypothetical protein
MEDWDLNVEGTRGRPMNGITPLQKSTKTKTNKLVAWVRERTMPTERLQLVGEVSTDFCR